MEWEDEESKKLLNDLGRIAKALEHISRSLATIAKVFVHPKPGRLKKISLLFGVAADPQNLK